MNPLRGGFRRVGAMAFLLLIAPAQAHTEFSTKGPFVSGIKHYFLSLDDVLVTLAAGIVMAQTCGRTARVPWWALPGAWWAAGIIGLCRSHAVQSGELLSAVSLIIVGTLAALSLAPAPLVVFLLSILVGALHGFLNGAAMHPETFASGIWQLCGIALSATVVVGYPGALLEIFKRPWAPIVARVAGSWIAATGLLLLGWTLRPQP
jgi:hydrogenase/urease accessory protein HupE